MTRPDEIEPFRQRGIPVPATIESPYSTDSNLWGRSIRCGVLEDPWVEPPEEIYTLTKSPADCPDQPAYVEIEFDAGVPVKVNGDAARRSDRQPRDDRRRARHRPDRHGRRRLVGIKSREIYEAPAAVALRRAQEIEKWCARDLERLKHDRPDLRRSRAGTGLWFTPTREGDRRLRGEDPGRVTGTIRLIFFKGDCRVVGRKSPFAHSPTRPGDLRCRRQVRPLRSRGNSSVRSARRDAARSAQG